MERTIAATNSSWTEQAEPQRTTGHFQHVSCKICFLQLFFFLNSLPPSVPLNSSLSISVSFATLGEFPSVKMAKQRQTTNDFFLCHTDWHLFSVITKMFVWLQDIYLYCFMTVNLFMQIYAADG